MTRRDEPLTRALESSASDLLGYLARRTNADDAPDLLGETMVVAWRRVKDLPGDPERARMWLFGIARGTLQNHARGQWRRWALADRIRGHVREDATAPAADAGADVRDAIARSNPSSQSSSGSCTGNGSAWSMRQSSSASRHPPRAVAIRRRGSGFVPR
ncbi:RNA polymerase sigma factor [Microbacterium paludicola]|uniref:RNA polymerase sigma factor n=1 Tax=Microbacterium paludicola TaxID=300019 RepID=UPI0021B62EAA|nr:sigma factor [Microbacterium paludicola]